MGMKEVVKASKEGRLKEAFGAGTAAVVSPIKRINFKGEDIDLPSGEEIGPVAQGFWDALTDIQYGRVEHPFRHRQLKSTGVDLVLTCVSIQRRSSNRKERQFEINRIILGSWVV